MRVASVTPLLVDPGISKNWLFVRVETETGVVGWGECYTQSDRDESIAAHVRELGRYLVGRHAGHIRQFVHVAYRDFAAKRGAMDFWSAVSGIEQAAATMPNFVITEYFVSFESRSREIASEPLEVERGFVRLPQRPGLGIGLREEVLARYPSRRFPARPWPESEDEPESSTHATRA